MNYKDKQMQGKLMMRRDKKDDNYFKKKLT